MTTRPVGRRRGDPEVTRETILLAARASFGQLGFERATIRTIAKAAAVDPALVIHHFKTKQQLFLAAHELPVDPAVLFRTVGELPVEERGRALVSSYLSIFTAPASPALSLLRAAATNDAAARMMREFIQRGVIDQGHLLIDGPDAELRMALLGSHLVGVLFARELIGIEPLVSADEATLIDAMSPVVQNYIQPP